MRLKKISPVLAILAMALMAVAMACAGDEATPTSPATATAPAPTGPTPTSGVEPTATMVPEPTESLADLTWMERYLKSPGYNPAWGQPVKGGTFIFGAQSSNTTITPVYQACCYDHGCWRGLPYSSLFGIDPWTGDLRSITGELVESWDMSEDGLTLTMKLREGVMFFDKMSPKSTVPGEFNGGKILGDEFVCEDAKATYERLRWPPEFLIGYVGTATADINHLESVTCPDGPRGYTFVMHFNAPLAKTMGILAGRAAVVMDKDYIAWLKAYGDREGVPFGRTEAPANFYSQHGTGPFIFVELNQAVSATYDANPNYWKEGLPLIDRYKNVVIKDAGSRFIALATGKVHYMGEGSYSMRPGQAQQALRDFPDRIVINNQLNHWARTIFFGPFPPWDDLRVRQAISLALDRDAWLDFYSIVDPNTGKRVEGMALAHTMAPGTFYAPTEEEIRTWPGYRQPKDQDVAEANRLMDEVFGEGNRPEASCMTNTESPVDVDACLFVMDNLKKNLGMSVTSHFGESAAVSPIRESGNFDMYIQSFTQSVIGDPDDDLYANYILEFASASIKGTMEARWQEMPETMAEVESLIRAQSRELDPLKRKEIVRELDLKILNDVSQYVLVGWSMIFPGWRVELKGWRGYDLYSYTKYLMNERMWLAK